MLLDRGFSHGLLRDEALLTFSSGKVLPRCLHWLPEIRCMNFSAFSFKGKQQKVEKQLK